jgi:hypothetical protein
MQYTPTLTPTGFWPEAAAALPGHGLPPFEGVLPAGSLRWLAAAAEPRRLQLLAGLLWLTRECDPLDHWLLAGDDFLLAPGSRVLVQAEAASRFQLLLPVSLAARRRWPWAGRSGS